MLSTYLRAEAARRLRHGLPWVFRDEIVSMEGTPAVGEPVELRDEAGHRLGLGDVDLQSSLAIRRLGLPDEPVEGLIQRHLRAAAQRRAFWLDDVRYGRLVNDDGDGLPGLLVDRFESHYAVQTLTRAMDARLEELVRSLREVMGATSVVARNDTPMRGQLGLPLARPHVLLGSPPRWVRVADLGARLTMDLMMGPGTGFPFEEREVRRLVGRVAQGARVLNPGCGLGGLFVQAGRHGARSVLAAEPSAAQADLARENAEANGLMGRATVEVGDTLSVLEGVGSRFDLVLLRVPEQPLGGPGEASPFVRLVRAAIRATRHGGRLVLLASSAAAPPQEFDDLVALACELEGRLGYQLARPGLPGDFPLVLGSPTAVTLSALALEVS